MCFKLLSLICLNTFEVEMNIYQNICRVLSPISTGVVVCFLFSSVEDLVDGGKMSVDP